MIVRIPEQIIYNTHKLCFFRINFFISEKIMKLSHHYTRQHDFWYKHFFFKAAIIFNNFSINYFVFLFVSGELNVRLYTIAYLWVIFKILVQICLFMVVYFKPGYLRRSAKSIKFSLLIIILGYAMSVFIF